MSKGFDTTEDLSSRGQQILDSGYAWVGRYYYSGISHSKTKLSRAEALHLSGMGIFLVAVFENAGDHAGYFSAEQGDKDGQNAFWYADNTIRQPLGTPIYFAVDFDASEHDLQSHIIPYFRELWKGIQGDFKIGVYGSGFVCRRLASLGLVSYTWLAQSKGWAESREKRDYNIVQHDTITWHGIEIDPGDSNGNGGGFRVS